jgi:hypothetical protein
MAPPPIPVVAPTITATIGVGETEAVPIPAVHILVIQSLRILGGDCAIVVLLLVPELRRVLGCDSGVLLLLIHSPRVLGGDRGIVIVDFLLQLHIRVVLPGQSALILLELLVYLVGVHRVVGGSLNHSTLDVRRFLKRGWWFARMLVHLVVGRSPNHSIRDVRGFLESGWWLADMLLRLANGLRLRRFFSLFDIVRICGLRDLREPEKNRKYKY